MIEGFADQGTRDIAYGVNSPAARRACPQQLWPAARRKLDNIDQARQLDELTLHPGNRLELLRGNRRGQHSLRINDQYRICFVWQPGRAYAVVITDYHD